MKKGISIRQLFSLCADYFKVSLEQIISKSREKELVQGNLVKFFSIDTTLPQKLTRFYNKQCNEPYIFYIPLDVR
jgi:hypothetical protein